MILDRDFPRAVYHCLAGADWSLHEIVGSPVGTFRHDAERRLGSLKAELAYSDVDVIIDHGLHEFIDNLQKKMNTIDEALNEAFFSIRPVETARGQMQWQG